MAEFMCARDMNCCNCRYAKSIDEIDEIHRRCFYLIRTSENNDLENHKEKKND